MPEPDQFWEFYWETRLAEIETLGKRAAILAASRAIRRLAGRLDRPLRLLELGCGEGQIIGILLDAHAALCDVRASAGIDYKAQSIECCRKFFPGARWVHGDFTDPKFMDGLGKFDVVLLVNVLHEVFSSAYSDERGEIDVPLGKLRVDQALIDAASCLTPLGNLILFDGLEPDGDPDQRVRVRLLSTWARDEFEMFVREYRPFHITYQEMDDPFCIELSQHDFIRYIDKSIFLGKQLWETERLESYQYFSKEEFRSAFAKHGMEIIDLETFTVNGEKWRKRVEIIPPEAGFPQEHVLIVAQRVADTVQRETAG